MLETIYKKLFLKSERNKALPDYDTYTMTFGEKALYLAMAAVFIYIGAFVFYRSHVISLMLVPLSVVYPRIKKGELLARRRRELNTQFKDMLYSLSSSLSAGKSIENAVGETLRDLTVLYPDANEHIIVEAEHMARRIEMNETVEAVLSDFARRARMEDVENFSDVFQICKRTGGNIVEVVRNTSGIINDKIEIRQEIDMLLAQRKFEQKVLNVVPLAMIVLLSASAADYMEPVFTTAVGRLVMTAAIGLLAAAWFISRKIMDIKV